VARLQGKSSWLKELLAGLAAASGIGYLATSYTVSRWLTRSSPGKPRHTPGDRGLSCEPLQCLTADGLRLRGWLVEPSAVRGTVALFHGMRKNREQTLERIELLAAAGYRCVAFDHRAHGESAGRRTSFGYHEARDAAAVLDLVARRWPDQPRAALGMSMGAAALCFAAPQARALDAVVLESLYHDLASTFQTRIGTRYPAWFGRFRRGVIWVTERRLRLRLGQVVPSECVADLAPAPVLLVTGSDDPHAPPDDTRRLFERCGEPRECAVISGADHLTLLEAGGRVYCDLLLDFLDRRLARPSARAA
jgi:alpha-beta hydrolase superfamily lysophospholipase